MKAPGRTSNRELRRLARPEDQAPRSQVGRTASHANHVGAGRARVESPALRTRRLPGKFAGCFRMGFALGMVWVASILLTTIGPVFAQPPAKAPVSSAVPPGPGNEVAALPEQVLARKQETQRRVRAMARDLVSAILDIQLQQLRENDLEGTELYRDIEAMRGQIDALIDAEMPQVVKLLADIQSAQPDQREQVFVAARQKSREILVRLLAERQRVLRRLRIAELAAQVRQLLQAETKIHDATRSLPEQPAAQRETLALSTIEDQRDAKAVYLRLHETVKEVATWGGEVGSLASAGLQMLQKARVDAEMENAARSLEQASFAEAAAHEENAIRALKELLAILERVQGVLKGQHDSAEQAIREMIDRQAEIREATRQADTERDLKPLVEQQIQVQKDLEALSRQVQPVQPLEEASKAAEEAAARLFEGKPQEAIAEQDKVLERLAKAAESVPQAANAESRPPSAEMSAQSIADLEAARRDLRNILDEQKQVSAVAAEQPAQARPREEKIARDLAHVPNNRRLPEPVIGRTAEAQHAANEAAARMASPRPERDEAVRAAEQAIQRAISETERALADAQRQQLREAMNVLANTAEEVQKAAALERDVARDAHQGAEKSGLEASQAQDLKRKQAQVRQTAEESARRVEQVAPEAAKTLAAARQPIQQAAEQLETAARQPGEPSKPAAKEAAAQAGQAAQQLSQAAQQLRDAASKAADRLEQLTRKQLEQAHQTLASVEKAIAERPEPLAERIDRLAKAEEHVRKAQADQEQARGQGQQKPDAQAQSRVAQEALAAQQLAQPDAPKAAATLAEARKASAEAQRQMQPEGNMQEAAKAQEQTAQDLQQAAQQLAEAKRRLAEEAAKALAAQSQAAHALEDQAMPVDPGATGALQSAENQATKAAGQLPQSPEVVPPAEKGVAEAMDRAAADLAARIQELAQDQAVAQATAAQASPASPKPSDSSSPTVQGGTARKGPVTKNPPPAERPLEVPDRLPDRDSRGTVAAGTETGPDRDRVSEAPWFAQLPPEVRAAIRANAQRRPPRGYEERLQRYFKNLD